jgi:hypothetical protein
VGKHEGDDNGVEGRVVERQPAGITNHRGRSMAPIVAEHVERGIQGNDTTPCLSHRSRSSPSTRAHVQTSNSASGSGLAEISSAASPS